MESCHVVSLSQERAGALFDAADVDKSGTVDFEAGASDTDSGPASV